jgi:hypothetical protein
LARRFVADLKLLVLVQLVSQNPPDQQPSSTSDCCICKLKNTLYGQIPFLRHNNARYKIQLTLVSQYHHRCILYLALLCRKSGISSTHDFGIERNDSGIKHTSTLVQRYNNATIINTLIILVALRHDFLIIQLLLINDCYRLSSS